MRFQLERFQQGVRARFPGRAFVVDIETIGEAVRLATGP